MPSSIIDAIKQGQWDYEPVIRRRDEFPATRAMPGTQEKLKILADRLSHGLPLWHPEDCNEYDDPLNEKLSRL